MEYEILRACYFPDYARPYRTPEGYSTRNLGENLKMSKLSAVALLTVVALSGQTAKSAELEENAIRNALMQWTTAFNESDSGKICGIFAQELRYNYRGYT
jgi:hypothetical protein